MTAARSRLSEHQPEAIEQIAARSKAGEKINAVRVAYVGGGVTAHPPSTVRIAPAIPAPRETTHITHIGVSPVSADDNVVPLRKTSDETVVISQPEPKATSESSTLLTAEHL